MAILHKLERKNSAKLSLVQTHIYTRNWRPSLDVTYE